MEIFVGNNAGYVWGFDHTGRVLSEWGWPKRRSPGPGHAGGQHVTRGVHSSPAIGDTDGDGDLDVVVGSWGFHI